MSSRILLLFAHLGVELAVIGRGLREAGHLVFPARYHEEGADALVRVRPELALVDLTHHRMVCSPAFQQAARELGVHVLFYVRGGSGAAALRAEAGDLPYPVVEFSGDGRALVAEVAEVLRGFAA